MGYRLDVWGYYKDKISIRVRVQSQVRVGVGLGSDVGAVARYGDILFLFEGDK